MPNKNLPKLIHMEDCGEAVFLRSKTKTKKQPNNCGTCNYCRQPGAISPEPKQDSVWCSNSKSKRYMTYITLTNRCKEHQPPTPQQIEAAERFMDAMDKLGVGSG